MVEVADATKRIYDAIKTVVRASRYPPEEPDCPCAFVAPPQERFHSTFDAGGSDMDVSVVLLVGRVDQDKLARLYERAEPYRAKSGTQSIYAALEAAEGVWVKSADHSAVLYAGEQYVGATFTVGVED